MEYTKGEWKVGEENDVYLGEEQSACIARVCGAPEGIEESIANAHLIAAAPKQNKALQEVERFLKEEMPYFNGDLDELIEDLQITVGQALAKAEGK